MTKEELRYTLTIETYLLRKGVRPSVLVGRMTESNLSHLDKFCAKNKDIKYCFDPCDDDFVWLFRNDSIGILIKNIDRMGHEAYEVAMGVLLGYSVREESEWFERIRKDKK